MATTWTTVLKRQVGASNTLTNDTVALVNSTTALTGGAAEPTTWTFINKTS